jgi:hypothetical protein
MLVDLDVRISFDGPTKIIPQDNIEILAYHTLGAGKIMLVLAYQMG